MKEKEASVTRESVRVLDDKDSLLKLYSEFAKSAQYVVDKIWTNARFFTTLTSALLTFSIAALAKSWLEAPNKTENSTAYFFLILLPILIIIISYIGIKNLYREYRRFLDWITARAKIQERLGLCEEIESKIYPEDRYILPLRFIKNSYNSSEEFVNKTLKKKHTLCFYFKILHISYAVIAIIISIFMCLLGLGVSLG